MPIEHSSALVDPQRLGWTAERGAAALAVVVPNDQRIAAAAAAQLRLDDHAATFAAWCDAEPVAAVPSDPSR